ncbi:hypothetical protein V6N13_092085 [Hibiscus sabdariffa]
MEFEEVYGWCDADEQIKSETSSVSLSESVRSKTPAPESEGRQEVEDEALNAMYLGKDYNNGNSCDTLAANGRLGESDMLGTESNEVRGEHADIKLGGDITVNSQKNK